MKVWGVTEDEIRESAAEVGLKIYGDWQDYGNGGIVRDGRALRFRLGVNTLAARDSNGSLPYQRRSQSRGMNGRRIAAVCWHGHRDFMRALFSREPDARIKTALADYRGAEDFEDTFSETFGEGNNYNLAYGQACVCDDAHALV